MVQAARSGKQNIAEASQASGTSKEAERRFRIIKDHLTIKEVQEKIKTAYLFPGVFM